MSQLKSFPQHVREQFKHEIQKEFNFSIDKRLVVIADTEQYKASVDESVWLQKGEKAPKMFEVYWDSEWIMDFSTDTEKEIVFALFWNGFYKAYTENRIRLNQGLAESEPKMLDTLFASNKKRLDSVKTSSPLDKEADAILAEIAKEKSASKPAS